jgi:hypothetical protein
VNTNRDPLQVSVTETTTSRYSGSDLGMNVDAGVQGVDVLHSEGDGALSVHHGATDLLPGLRNQLRSVDEVERDRGVPSNGFRSGWLLPIGLGIGAFVLMLAASPLVIWLALSSHEDEAKPEAPPQDELMGIPVRRGLKPTHGQ